jgi:glucose/arabinose dehydrogenase
MARASGFARYAPRAFYLSFCAAALAAVAGPGGCGGETTAMMSSGSSTTASGTSTDTSSSTSTGGGGDMPEGGPDGDGGPPGPSFCDLPGSLIYDGNGSHLVPGGKGPDLSWLKVPSGFCVHYFGNIPNTRQMRFAPGGELFVASPTTSTTGGGANGMAAIMVMPDDDHDGYADNPNAYLNSLPSTQGIMFTPGYFYYQDDTRIRRLNYQTGQRLSAVQGTEVVNITLYTSAVHWPKPLDIADDGSIYVGNGGDQGEACDPAKPFHGGIMKIDGTPGGSPVCKGFRNPIAVRCHAGFKHCFATELALDYSGAAGGREKLIPIRQGDDWGYPCCATKDTPYTGNIVDCSKVQSEYGSYVIGETPFGLEFDYGHFPGKWKNNVFVVLHGEFGTWTGARVVAGPTDPKTGDPVPSSTLKGAPNPPVDFATGWDDVVHAHGRPGSLVESPDGRMFVGNDVNGDIVWIAPVTAKAPPQPDGGTDGGTDGGDAGPDASDGG